MNGYRSHIFEHHTVPGGVAACWKRKGYLTEWDSWNELQKDRLRYDARRNGWRRRYWRG